MPKTAESEGKGLGRSKTDFDRLLDGFVPVNGQPEQSENRRVDEENLEQPIIEPATTLMQVDEPDYETDYPEETDQIPETCSWMDEEDISLVEADSNKDPNSGQGEVALGDYVKRVRTVQRKMTQLTNRRKADTTFVKQELGMLIETYQLENDQSLEWLFQQHKPTTQTDYGSIFDRIESLTV